MEQKGYIYILTNPSFKHLVKIGYANNVEQRVKELNRSSAVPYSFRVYATYEVNSKLKDLNIHKLIDQLNPDLRCIEKQEGTNKKRVREFYEITPEEAYSILEAIALINDYTHKLKRWEMNEKEKREEQDEKASRLSSFKFSYCNIKPGEEIISIDNPQIKAIVCDDDKHVLVGNKRYSLSSLAKEITHGKRTPQGTIHFTYNGVLLSELRKKINKG